MSTLECPTCHWAVEPTDLTCAQCGTVLTPAPFPLAASDEPSEPPPGPPATTMCPNCEAIVNVGDAVCTNCGVPLRLIRSDPPVVATVAPPPVQAAPATQVLEAVPPSPPLDECPNCHNRRRPTARFCARCGYNFALNMPAQVNPLAIGRVINKKYRLTKIIATGSIHPIYLAEDLVLRRQVVIKVLLVSDDPAMLAKSIKDREFLMTLSHPNIVAVYDFFILEQTAYIVMEQVIGRTLHKIMERQGGPLAVPEAIKYILGVLPAFIYLAQHNLVYSDFKAENVVVDLSSEGFNSIKLIDLSTIIPWVAEPPSVYGTSGFFAPEAVRHPSPATDLYSICRTLGWMVSWMDLDNPPFSMPSSEDIQVFEDFPVLYRLLYKGTHPNPLRRFQNAVELLTQLTGVLRLIVGGTPGEPPLSRLFVPGIVTNGRLGLCGEAAVDERDPALALIYQGDQDLRSGNPIQALNGYNQALNLNPQSIDARLRRAELLSDAGEVLKALSDVTRVRRIAPNTWKVIWYTARLLEGRGNLNGAAYQYMVLMNELPGEVMPHFALARVRARQRQDALAVRIYSAVLHAEPQHTEATLQMVASLMRLDRWEDSIRALNSIDESNAKYIDAQFILGEIYLERITPLTTANLEQAAQAVERLTGATQEPRYYLLRANLYRAARQLARKRQLPATLQLIGVSNLDERTLGEAAEASYVQYLERAGQIPNREVIVRRRFDVAPWRVW